MGFVLRYSLLLVGLNVYYSLPRGWGIRLRSEMGWEAYTQQGNLSEIDQLGSELSLAIHCPVHYPAYNKNLFECKCGVIFPLYMVKGKDWKAMTQKHIEERKLIKP